MQRVKTFVKWFLILVVVPFGTPQLISYASGYPDGQRSWSTARRDASGLSPSPQDHREAVVQVFGARTWGWRGTFAVHTWLAVKDRDAPHYTRYEVLGWRAYRGGSALAVGRGSPDNHWYGSAPELLADLRGTAAEQVIARLPQVIGTYPHKSEYRLWPGPNSNSFIAYIGRNFPELKLDLPPTAIGKDYLANGEITGPAISGDGFQLSLMGYGGFLVSPEQGMELHVLGLTAGFDFDDLALKVPGFGRLALKGRPEQQGYTR
ncbi:DUF3750 domain-containing protein [Sneathiella chinensis]|uniref:DUF3750 domain-containing protein n=1 Tax=Sneathiella chinensis TaxID=349750 RepID=A0ABQ5U6M9_9PROT|nr:DUF3750 domain-containing protein [Sneathiella chinensis]GLQ07056.1 hypothetical protein GCM10007924_22770 [Sneathiella chinensis]